MKIGLRAFWAIVPLGWLGGAGLALWLLLLPGWACGDVACERAGTEWCGPFLLAVAIGPGLAATTAWLLAWRRRRVRE